MTTGNLLEVRLKASDRVGVDVRFASDWLRLWRQFILDQSRSEVKQNSMQFRITFDTQLKTFLISNNRCLIESNRFLFSMSPHLNKLLI